MSPPPGGKNRAAKPSQRGFGARIVRQFLPSEDLGQESRRDTFPAKIWGKNRAAIPSQRRFGARIAPRYLASEVLGQESRRDTFPARIWAKNRAAIPCQRRFGARYARKFLASEVLGQDTRVNSLPAKFWGKNRATIPCQRSFGARIARQFLASEVLEQDTRVNSREFDEFHFMCAALLSPNCRDAFLRLSQLPSLRDWRFYSAILLAETQECVSTTFRRTHVKFFPSEVLGQDTRVNFLPAKFWSKIRA